MSKRELLERARYALNLAMNHEGDVFGIDHNDVTDTLIAIEAELAKPEPEPFAYVTKTGLELARQHEDDVPLYRKDDAL
jgi:hypothetical protein